MKHRITLVTKSGPLVLEPGTKVVLVKEPENPYDDEAIKVFCKGTHLGHVANGYKIRLPGTISAGRALDKIPDQVEAVVVEDGIAEVFVGEKEKAGAF